MKNLIGIVAMVACFLFAPSAQAEGMKVILDTDFGTMNDDGQVLVMAAQLDKEGVIDLLGVTTVTGNDWLLQETSDALRAVERLGIEKKVGVYAGANLPLVHDPRSFEYERALFGFGENFKNAFHRPQPTKADLIAPPDGFAQHTKVQNRHAVDFIIDTIKANPHEVSILAIGPVTNIALAIRKAPEIVPLIDKIVYMGGAFDVRGNTTPAAEMNIWVDPEAARIVLREPIPQAMIPLDVTNITQLTRADYDRIVKGNSPIQQLFRDAVGPHFEKNPDARLSIYDTLALGYLVNPAFATKVEDLWVDVDIAYGAGYGRTLGYWQEQPAKLLQRVRVVKAFDTGKFFDFYVDLLSRPVPIR